MDPLILDLLRRVEGGEHSFSPDSDSDTALLAFQRIAKAAIAAERMGFFTLVTSHLDSDSPVPDAYDTVFIENVTDTGRDALSRHRVGGI